MKRKKPHGIHYILDNLGFRNKAFFHKSLKGEHSTHAGTLTHNELAKIAKGDIQQELYHKNDLLFINELKEWNITCTDSNVSVKDDDPLFPFNTEIDLMGVITLKGKEYNVLIELKTTTGSSSECEKQLSGNEKYEFENNHPLKEILIHNNSLTRAFTQLFLMYHCYVVSHEDQKDIIPMLIYIFNDKVQLFYLFDQYPALKNHISVYSSIKEWYGNKFKKG